jgi:ankyrin repeat protein
LEIILQQKDEVERLEHHPDRYPVNQAAEFGHNKCLEILLRHGFSPNIVTSTGETALRSAIQAGRIDLCKILLDNKADPDLTPENANTPLIQAISMGDLGMVKLLIEHGATIDKREAPPDEGWSRTPRKLLMNQKT